jgi:hypothetical protein
METREVTFDETQPHSQCVEVTMNLARTFSRRRRSLNMEMMKMAAWCPHLSMYLLLRL